MAKIYPVSYSSVSDVYSVMSNIGSVSNVGSIEIAYELGRVEALVNARLSRLYSLPLSSVPLVISKIVTDLSIYGLSKRFAIFQKSNDQFEKYRDDALQTLADIVDGKLPLLDSSLQVISMSSNSGLVPWSNTKTFTPTFNEDEFENQFLDDTKND